LISLIWTRTTARDVAQYGCFNCRSRLSLLHSFGFEPGLAKLAFKMRIKSLLGQPTDASLVSTLTFSSPAGLCWNHISKSCSCQMRICSDCKIVRTCSWPPRPPFPDFRSREQDRSRLFRRDKSPVGLSRSILVSSSMLTRLAHMFEIDITTAERPR